MNGDYVLVKIKSFVPWLKDSEKCCGNWMICTGNESIKDDGN